MTRSVDPSLGTTCDPSDNTDVDARGGEGQNAACDPPAGWCTEDGKCVTYAEYSDPARSDRSGMPREGEGGVFSGLYGSGARDLQELYAIEGGGDRSATTITTADYGLEDSDAELSSGEEITAIFTRIDSDYRTGGYYDSPVFLATENLNFASYLEDGDMGIYYDKFFRYLVTYTLYYPAETVDAPMVLQRAEADASWIDTDPEWGFDEEDWALSQLLEYVSPQGTRPEDMSTGVIASIFNVAVSISEAYKMNVMSEDAARAVFVTWTNWQALEEAKDRMKP